MCRRLVLAALFLAASATGLPATGRANSFMGLGFLPGGSLSVANAVSADGSVVVGASNERAFRWTQSTGMVDLGGDGISARGVSADGSVVVGAMGPLLEAFRWTAETGMIGLGTLPGGGTTNASGVSADGSVVVGTSVEHEAPGTIQAFRWTAGDGMTGLGFLAGDVQSQANAVSGDGSVVIGFSLYLAPGEGFTRAFRWTEDGGMVGLLPSVSDSFAEAVSADGSVVVGGNDARPFRWTATGGEAIPGIDTGTASGVSGDGSVVVGNGVMGTLGSTVFVWDAEHGTQSLLQMLADDPDLAGWRLEAALAISSDGRTIVGYGRNPDGNLEAWIAVIPEPATGLLILLGVAGLAVSRGVAR